MLNANKKLTQIGRSLAYTHTHNLLISSSFYIFIRLINVLNSQVLFRIGLSVHMISALWAKCALNATKKCQWHCLG